MKEPTTRKLLDDLLFWQVRESEAAKHIHCAENYCGVLWSVCRRGHLPGIILRIQQVKKVLATREHVPNKAERKEARRHRAQSYRGQGKSRNR